MKLANTLSTLLVLAVVAPTQAAILEKVETFDKTSLNEAVQAQLALSINTNVLTAVNTKVSAEKILVKQSYQLASKKSANEAQAEISAE